MQDFTGKQARSLRGIIFLYPWDQLKSHFMCWSGCEPHTLPRIQRSDSSLTNMWLKKAPLVRPLDQWSGNKSRQVKTSSISLKYLGSAKSAPTYQSNFKKTSNNPSCLTLKLFILSPKPAIPGQGACTTSEGEWLGPKIYQGLGWARAGFGSNIIEHIISINIYIYKLIIVNN